MEELEQKILKSFIKYEGKEVEGLDLVVFISPDYWGEDGEYLCDVLESKENGRVWTCECTRSGKIKETYEL